MSTRDQTEPTAQSAQDGLGASKQKRPPMGTDELLRMLLSIMSRIAVPEERLRNLVAGRAKLGAKWITAYNLCDGTRGVTEIARQAGLDQAALSRAAVRWVEAGIVFRVGPGERFLYGLYPLTALDDQFAADAEAPTTQIENGDLAEVRRGGTARSRRDRSPTRRAPRTEKEVGARSHGELLDSQPPLAEPTPVQDAHLDRPTIVQDGQSP